MSNGALFPPRIAALSEKGRAWRKVLSSKKKESSREQSDGNVTLAPVLELTLECGHTAFQAQRTLGPPDRIICKQCEKGSSG